MSKALDKIKEDLLARRAMEELLNPERNKEREKLLAQGLRDVPVNQIISHIHYLENELLPRVKKKAGTAESADVKFFTQLLDSLTWCVVLYDRYDTLAIQYNNKQVMLQLSNEHRELLQKELEKYQTVEELFLTDALDRYVENVRKRVVNLKKNKGGKEL